ncbi:response regulator [Dyadobacter sandarakinus]|uniref:histidine kinase n=1 Tax=Dyadobacter sandarakinus TaxID=2747268 RepID=A0ABX7I3F8_9BACT|nr:response regulator [Dyadobacter sandarakinus]QRR00374.1 response regulator [Dyadobacter sandarakinus]
MRLTFQRQVLIGISFSIFLVFVVGFTSYIAINIQETSSRLVDHTREVMRSSASVRNLLLRAEASIRGYVITRNSAFENNYHQASGAIPGEMDKLRTLVADNPTQVSRIDTLAPIMQSRIDVMAHQYDVLKSGNYDADTIKKIILLGRNLSSQIEFQFNRIEHVEEELLVEREQKAAAKANQAKQFILGGSLIFLLVILLLYYFIRKTYLSQIAQEKEILEANRRLEALSMEDQIKNWILNAAADVNTAIRGIPTQVELSERLLSRMAEVTGSIVSVIYSIDRTGDSLVLTGKYGVDEAREIPLSIQSGEGILGQLTEAHAGVKKLEVAPDYLAIRSGTGGGKAAFVYIKPVVHDDRIVAMIELGFLSDPGEKVAKLLDMISDNVGVAVMAAQSRQIAIELLEKTQLQAEELESQQEELRVTNEELTRQTSLLQVSEEELRVQQEELKQINTELEEKAVMLEEQKKTIEEARDQVQVKADELERSGRFKSEFLANMSHELRTPLNSILILSRILGENKGARLSDEEQRYASVIHNSGNDLLTLINDILDLAKVESGKIELFRENVKTDLVLYEVRSTFQTVAENKGLTLKVEKQESCPDQLYIDQTRLMQIIRNLLSNAIKFTSTPGTVSLSVGSLGKDLFFEVADTGIGIPEDKQKSIFEAFQQADGSTSRKYGGTGLGLSISREMAILFGGSISLKSTPGEGSVFTLWIPNVTEEVQEEAVEVAPEPVKVSDPKPVSITKPQEDGREERLLLIEDDEIFAADMSEKARTSGFDVAVAYNGRDGLAMVRSFRPTAIILDMNLPDMSGNEVLQELKSDTRTRLIPVHTVSSGDYKSTEMLRNGAVGFMQKPVNKKSAESIFDLLKLEGKDLEKQRILLIEDDTYQSKYVGDFLAENNILVLYAYSGEEALNLLRTEPVDGIILDVRLADMNGLDLLDTIKKNPEWDHLPVVVNTAEDLSQADLSRVMKYAHPVVMKTRKSNERLLDEVKLFLKKIQPKNGKPEPKEEFFANPVVHAEHVFVGRKILLADDDMRNIFALSAVLEEAGFTIEIATNGLEAIARLEESANIELVLMDVMMPEMDGIEATRRIRQVGKWANLPIIAVTAKAMQGDREQCLAAGANDYISKPVDIDKLLSLIKVWLHSA